ncbi:MAG: hypothetical protein GYB65_19000 [Chloroflexi bacterium]|nr:hypothetical protein [Chloroflexota bacterium]
MDICNQAVELVSPMTLADKAQLLEYLSASLKDDITTEAYRHMPKEDFVKLTYSSLADDPIERNQPPYPDVRDEIE